MNRLSFIFCFLSFIFLSLQAQTSRFEEYILYPATGGPLVGATVVLEDLDTGTNYPLSEVIGKPGLYRSDNIPMMRYKLIINGATSSTGLFFPAYRIQQFLDIVDSDADNRVDGLYLESASVGWTKLSEEVKDSVRAGGGGTVNITNVPDDTTLTTNASDQLKIKDLGVDTQHLKGDAVTTAKVLDGTLNGNDVQNGALPYNKLDSASVYTWFNASGAFSESAVDFLPIDAVNMTGALGDFSLPTGLGSGSITITAGQTTTGMEFDYAVVVDSLLEEGRIVGSAIDSIEANDRNIASDWIFQTEGSVTFEEEPTLSGGDFVTDTDFGDYLKSNFGITSDSINNVRNTRSIILAQVIIDSSEIYTTGGKHFIAYFAQDISIDTVFVLWDPGIGASPSIDIMLKYGKNFGLTGTNIFEADQTVTSTSTGHKITELAVSSISHGNFMWVTFPAISDKREQLIIVIIGKQTSNL